MHKKKKEKSEEKLLKGKARVTNFLDHFSTFLTDQETLVFNFHLTCILFFVLIGIGGAPTTITAWILLFVFFGLFQRVQVFLLGRG